MEPPRPRSPEAVIARRRTASALVIFPHRRSLCPCGNNTCLRTARELCYNSLPQTSKTPLCRVDARRLPEITAMPTPLIVLTVVLVILAVVTLVGHGIWMILAALFGGGRAHAPSQPCVFCGTPTPGAEPGATGAEKTSTARWPRNWPTSRPWSGSCCGCATTAPWNPRRPKISCSAYGRIGAHCWNQLREKRNRRFWPRS